MKLTMSIDVHDKLLFYVVCAWEADFTGYLLDYGIPRSLCSYATSHTPSDPQMNGKTTN